MMKNKIVIIIVICLIILAGFQLWQQGIKSENGQSTKPSVVPTNTTKISYTNAPASTFRKISIEGNDYFFFPAIFTVKKGQKVEVTLINTGLYPHNFTLRAFNIQTETIKPQERTSLIFTPNKVGSFQFFSTVSSDTQKGMTGKFNVQ